MNEFMKVDGDMNLGVAMMNKILFTVSGSNEVRRCEMVRSRDARDAGKHSSLQATFAKLGNWC